MTYKFSRYDDDSKSFIKYNFDTYEETLAWVNEQLAQFLKVNNVRDESKDQSYLDFKEELLSCLEVKKPTEENPEETRISRNIREARERRARGGNPWCC